MTTLGPNTTITVTKLLHRTIIMSIEPSQIRELFVKLKGVIWQLSPMPQKWTPLLQSNKISEQ
jgi:hypothetical protein